MSGILRLLLTVVVVGLVAWLCTLLPLPAPFPTVIVVVACIACVIMVARELGAGV